MFWKSSNINNQLLDNVSAKCFSIGYHFDDENLLDNINHFTSIYPLLTVNTSCFHNNYEVSNRVKKKRKNAILLLLFIYGKIIFKIIDRSHYTLLEKNLTIQSMGTAIFHISTHPKN